MQFVELELVTMYKHNTYKTSLKRFLPYTRNEVGTSWKNKSRENTLYRFEV